MVTLCNVTILALLLNIERAEAYWNIYLCIWVEARSSFNLVIFHLKFKKKNANWFIVKHASVVLSWWCTREISKRTRRELGVTLVSRVHLSQFYWPVSLFFEVRVTHDPLWTISLQTKKNQVWLRIIIEQDLTVIFHQCENVIYHQCENETRFIFYLVIKNRNVLFVN